MKVLNKTLAFGFAAIASTQAFGVAETAHPRDFAGGPVGVNMALLYNDFRAGDDFYVDGNKVTDQANYTLQQHALRLLSFKQWRGMRIDPQIIIPWAKVETDLGIAQTGFADILIGNTFRVIHDEANQEWLNFTPWLWLPTGQYDKNEALNLGTNRLRPAFSVGYVKGLTDNLLVDVVGDVEFFADNKDIAGGNINKKEEIYRFNLMASYSLSPANYVWAKFSGQTGGQEKIDGVAEAGTRLRTQTAVVGFTQWLAPTVQVKLEYAQDIEVYNGPKTNGLSVRFVQVL